MPPPEPEPAAMPTDTAPAALRPRSNTDGQTARPRRGSRLHPDSLMHAAAREKTGVKTRTSAAQAHIDGARTRQEWTTREIREAERRKKLKPDRFQAGGSR